MWVRDLLTLYAGVYGIVKIVMTAIGLMAFTEQIGRKWSLIMGSLGQAFAML
jgi:SP family sugar:H+ symporter-like MFS transporter